MLTLQTFGKRFLSFPKINSRHAQRPILQKEFLAMQHSTKLSIFYLNDSMPDAQV
jgi:hypothetical protein